MSGALYKTPEELFQAAKEHRLPEDFAITIDNDSTYAYGCHDDDEDDCFQLLGFDYGPRELLESALTFMGIRTEHP